MQVLPIGDTNKLSILKKSEFERHNRLLNHNPLRLTALVKYVLPDVKYHSLCLSPKKNTPLSSWTLRSKDGNPCSSNTLHHHPFPVLIQLTTNPHSDHNAVRLPNFQGLHKSNCYFLADLLTLRPYPYSV